MQDLHSDQAEPTRDLERPSSSSYSIANRSSEPDPLMYPLAASAKLTIWLHSIPQTTRGASVFRNVISSPRTASFTLLSSSTDNWTADSGFRAINFWEVLGRRRSSIVLALRPIP